MKFFCLVVVLVLVFGEVSANDRVKSLSLVTGTGDYCDMDSGAIRVEISGNGHRYCSTGHLDLPGDDWERGDTNVFTGTYLGDCNNAWFPEGIHSFDVRHEGSDGWCFQSGTVKLDDGRSYTCSPNVILDDNSHWQCNV